MYDRLQIANEVSNTINELYASESMASSFKSAIKYHKFLQKYGFGLRAANVQSVINSLQAYPKNVRCDKLQEMLDDVLSLRKEYPEYTRDENAKSMDRLIGILEHELDMCDIKATMYKILDSYIRT